MPSRPWSLKPFVEGRRWLNGSSVLSSSTDRQLLVTASYTARMAPRISLPGIAGVPSGRRKNGYLLWSIFSWSIFSSFTTLAESGMRSGVSVVKV